MVNPEHIPAPAKTGMAFLLSMELILTILVISSLVAVALWVKLTILAPHKKPVNGC